MWPTYLRYDQTTKTRRNKYQWSCRHFRARPAGHVAEKYVAVTEECFHRGIAEVVCVPVVGENPSVGHHRRQHVGVRQPTNHLTVIRFVLPRARRLGA